MRATRNILLLLGATALWLGTAKAQFTATAVYVDADIINATSLVDPLSEKVKDVPVTSFSLVINNPTRQDIWVNMQLKAQVTLDEDGITKSLFLPGQDPRTLTPFVVPPGGRVFRSTDAYSKEFSFSYTVDNSEKQHLKDLVSSASSGGKVPSGRYEVDISMQVVKVGNPPRDTSTINIQISPSSHLQVTVTNPTNATLIQPSDNGVEYPTQFPQFQWSYDTRGIILSVYEKRPEQASLEDAISASDPYLQVQIDRQASGNLTIFTYPQGAAVGPGITILKGPRPLDRGKSYVVVLDGIRTAFGYTIDPLRTIRLFKIADPQGMLIQNMLQSTFGGGAFQNFLNLIQDQNLTINSSHLTLNGVPLSAQELQVILNMNKNNIKSVRFEDQ